LSSIQSKTLSENKNNSNKTDSNNFENGAVNANHSYYESTDDEGGLIYTNNISSNVSLVSESSQNYSVENLSVTNLLEFVNTHKKILEEKNKLESALIILKKQVDFLTMENTDLKNKIHVVNDFISSYKKSNNNIDFNKKPFTV
jgi:L-ribulose-5-phosphate 3-epimerase UlaE